MTKKIEHLAANGIRFEPNKKLGYYSVGNDLYYNKTQAILAGSKIKNTFNLTNDPVHWSFNEDVFIRYPWHIEPAEDIRELYKRRAQQLRNSYDYLSLEFSGGGDSATVLFAFLLNDIHLDEVIYRYPEGGDKGVQGDPWDTRCENHLSEYEFAVKPVLRWISTNFVNTKITVHNYLDDMKNNMGNDESWIFKTRNALQPAQNSKHVVASSLEQKRLVDRNIKIGMIFGCDKPKVCLKGNDWFLYFIDPLANHNAGEMGEIENVTTELFYWAPEACDIIAKQAHMIKQWFELPQHESLQNLIKWPNGDFATRTVYEKVVRSIIYPDYDPNTFQCIKPSNGIYAEMDNWFYTNFKDTQYHQTWQAGINFLTENLDSRYLVKTMQDQVIDVKQYTSPLYHVGPGKNYKKYPVDALTDLNLARNDHRKFVHCINGKLSIY